MKRVTFKPEHVAPILDGTKRFTARWKDQRWREGEIIAAVTNQGHGKNKKPAFLTPAPEAFAHLECVSESAMFWKDFTDEMAAESGVTRDWYLRCNPTVGDFSRIYRYEFKVVA